MIRRFQLQVTVAEDLLSRTGGERAATAVQPRPAATVLLLRDGPPGAAAQESPAAGDPGRPDGGDDSGRPDGGDGPEVFLFRRVASLAFAAGMYVFPGGRVDPADDDPGIPWQGPEPARFAAALSCPEPVARASVVGAVRETFEECGVLLAATPEGRFPTGLDAPAWEQRREQLAAGACGLGELLREAGLVLRADLLHPWAHWITPPFEPRRYDTRFFVAAMPPGQQARDLGGEGEHAQWVRAAEAVRGYHAGQFRLMPPTLVCLEEMAAAGSVQAVLATPRTIRPVMPRLVRSGAGVAAGSEPGVGAPPVRPAPAVATAAAPGADPGARVAAEIEVDLDGLGGGDWLW